MATLKYRKSDGTYAAIPVIQGPVGPKGDKGDKGDNYGDGIYLPLTGGTMTGQIKGKTANTPWINTTKNGSLHMTTAPSDSSAAAVVSMKTNTGSWAVAGLHGSDNLYFVWGSDTNYTAGTNTTSQCYITSAGAIYGAVWNDYAEFRETKQFVKPGHVVFENGDDTLSQSYKRMLPACSIVSDTFGFAIGQTEKCKTPLAMAGRVLAYPNEDRNSYKPGDAVCSGPHGTVSKMTQDEKIAHPECIIGYVSCVPNYETWGERDTKVNGRIWIKVV